MRIVVSDYDGTLASRTGLLGDVPGAVREWRRAGNIFGIATGRDLPMTLTETEKWGIEFDFLICVNGAAIYDSDTSLLHSHLMPDSLPPRILSHPAALASMHYQLSGLGPLRMLLREGSWFPSLGIPYTEVTYDEALEIRGLGQISFAYASNEEREKWSASLDADLGSEIFAHSNKTTIDINYKGVDKAAGIEELLRIKGWSDDGLVAIGDGGNDVGMLERFGGFTVPDASPDAEKAATRVFANVPEMLAAI